MDFLSPRMSGRAVRPLDAIVVRELTPADLPLLEVEKGTERSPIKRLSERHHGLARRLASGLRTEDAAIESGYDPHTVSILKGDPAFGELIEFYRRDFAGECRGLHEQLRNVSGMALAELEERLETKPEDIALGALLEISKLGADRTGHGPSSTTNVNVNDGLAATLKLARERVAARREIEGEAKRITG